jgi:hypothetical protein
MPLRSRTRRQTEDERAAPARPVEPAPSNEIQRLLAMQQSAGNQAVAATLQRKVKIGDQKPPMVSHHAKVPAIPDDIQAAHPTALDAIATTARAWVVDKDLKGTYATTADFYKAVVKEVVGETVAEGPSKRDRWTILQAAVETDGAVTPVPWTRFKDTEQTLLEAELLACGIQRSTSGSTAAHGNKHGKLPKPIVTDDGKDLDTLAAADQMDKTPYFEFLISGGHKKTHGGIERAIIDIRDDRVWITAHYDKGSLAELVGVPGSVVTAWKAKVASYKLEFV